MTLQSRPSEVLWLRAFGNDTPKPEGASEVVYADAWDDLCDVSQRLADALRTVHKHALKHDPDYPGSAHEEKVDAALRSYDE